MWRNELLIYRLKDLINRNFHSQVAINIVGLHSYSGVKPNSSVFYQYHELLSAVILARVALKKVNKL